MVSGNSSLLNPTNYLLKEISLTPISGEPIDLRLVYSELNMYEDLFSNTLSGNIILNDSLNVPELLALSGYESLTVKLEVPEVRGTIEKVFWIYKQSDTTLVEHRKQIYVLHFASPEFIHDRLAKVSQSWKNEQQEKIVEAILKEHLHSSKKLFAEATEFRQHLVVPSWNPLQTINWITSRAVAKSSQAANFLFFETMDGFKFQSIETLLEQPPAKHPLKPSEDLRYVLHPSSYTDFDQRENFVSIEGYNYEDTFDTARNMSLGMYASKMITYDVTTKKIEEFEFKLNENWRNHTHVDPSEISSKGQGLTLPVTSANDPNKFSFFDSTDQRQILFPKHSNQYGSGEETVEDKSEDHAEAWLPLRISQLQQLTATRLNIVVPGDTLRRVGETVYVEIPSPKRVDDSTPKSELYDKYRRGKYLIVSIRHHVTKEGYRLHMQLVKDSVAEPLPNYDKG